MKDKITQLANDLEQDTVDEKYFEDLVEIFNTNVSSLYLCKLQKISGLNSKTLFFINNGLNIMCATSKLENFSFVQLDNLKEKLNFNFNLSKWKLQGPDEKLPNMSHPNKNKKNKKKGIVKDVNFDINTNSEMKQSKNVDHLKPPEKDELLESFVDEDRYGSAQKRYARINTLNENMESKFKLSENKKINRFKEKNNLLEMQIQNDQLNGFSDLKFNDI
jgi:hypothetical protein